MIAAVQIRGHIGARQPVKDTLKMLNLGKKHACSLLPDNPVNQGMLLKCRDFITYGPVTKETEEPARRRIAKEAQRPIRLSIKSFGSID